MDQALQTLLGRSDKGKVIAHKLCPMIITSNGESLFLSASSKTFSNSSYTALSTLD